MATSLEYIQILGFDGPTSGDPTAEVIINGINFQGGASQVQSFIDDVIQLVAGQSNVSTTVTTKYERVSTVL